MAHGTYFLEDCIYKEVRIRNFLKIVSCVFISCTSQPDRISLYTSMKLAMQNNLANQLTENQFSKKLC